MVGGETGSYSGVSNCMPRMLLVCFSSGMFLEIGSAFFFFFLLSLRDWLLRVSLLFSVALWSQIDFQFSPNICP